MVHKDAYILRRWDLSFASEVPWIITLSRKAFGSLHMLQIEWVKHTRVCSLDTSLIKFCTSSPMSSCLKSRQEKNKEPSIKKKRILYSWKIKLGRTWVFLCISKSCFSLLLSSPFTAQARVTLLYMLVPPKRPCTAMWSKLARPYTIARSM